MIAVSNFTIIQYTGNAPAPVPFFGKATKTMYRFGGTMRRLAIDSRDADGFLATYEGRQAAFAVVDVSLPIDDEIATPSDVKPFDDNNPPDEFDFTLLSGIGPAKHQALQEAGILTKAQFLAASVGSLVGLLTANEKTVLKWKETLAR